MELAIGEMWRPAANFNSMKPVCNMSDCRYSQFDPGGSSVVKCLTRDRGGVLASLKKGCQLQAKVCARSTG